MGDRLLDLILGAAVSVALGVGGWLFRWSRSTDTTLQNHATRINNVEHLHSECVRHREAIEAELWARFNARMDDVTVQLTQIAHSIGRLEGKSE